MSEQKLKSISEIESKMIDNGAICLSCHEFMESGHVQVWEDHGGGTPVMDYPNRKPWLSYRCPKCESNKSLSKMQFNIEMRKARLKRNKGVCLDVFHDTTSFLKGGIYNPKIGDDDQKWFIAIDQKDYPEDVIRCDDLKIPETELKCKECLQMVKGYIALTSQVFGDD